MADRKVTIAVESSADLQALADSKTALTELAAQEKKSGDVSKDSGDKKKKAGEETQKLGQATGRAAEMVGSLTGAFGANSPAAAQMGAGLRSIKGVIEGLSASGAGGLGGLATILVGTGVSLIVAYTNKVEENRKKIEAFKLQLQDNAREIQLSHMSELAKQHDELRAAIDAESDAYNRLSSARAAVDNAEKGSRMADITLKEKQAKLALKSDDAVGAERVAAEFSKQRRDLDTEYAIKDAKRTAEQKDHELASAQERLATTQNQKAELANSLEEKKAQVLALSQEKVDLFGSKAPTRQVLASDQAPGTIGRQYYLKDVVDEEKRNRRIAEIDNQLQGSKDGKTAGLTEIFGKLSDDYAAIVIRETKEKIEEAAKQLEADAALKNLSTVNTMNPRIDAADTALEGKSLAETTAKANLAKFHGGIEATRRSAESLAVDTRDYADRVDAEPFRKKYGANSPSYRDAKRFDQQLEDKAKKAADLAAASKAFEEQVKAMDPEAVTKSIVSMTAKLKRMNDSVEDLKKQVARP